MTYEDLLPSLVTNQMTVISPRMIYQPPFPKWYNPNATCAYHVSQPTLRWEGSKEGEEGQHICMESAYEEILGKPKPLV